MAYARDEWKAGIGRYTRQHFGLSFEECGNQWIDTPTVYSSYSDDEDGCGGLTGKLVVRSAGGSHYLTARTESAREVCLYWQTEAISGRPTAPPLSVCRQAVEADIAVLDEEPRWRASARGCSEGEFTYEVIAYSTRAWLQGETEERCDLLMQLVGVTPSMEQNTAEGQSSESVAWLMAAGIICFAEAFDVDT